LPCFCKNVKEIIVRRLGKFQKKHKTETNYGIATTTYKKNTLKNIATNETAIYLKKKHKKKPAIGL
jgi:hypothetical protein